MPPPPPRAPRVSGTALRPPGAGARLQGLSCLSVTDPAGPGPGVYASIPPRHTPNHPPGSGWRGPLPHTPTGQRVGGRAPMQCAWNIPQP